MSGLTIPVLAALLRKENNNFSAGRKKKHIAPLEGISLEIYLPGVDNLPDAVVLSPNSSSADKNRIKRKFKGSIDGLDVEVIISTDKK